MPTLSDICSLLKLPAPANASAPITGINTLSAASPTEISFLGSDAYLNEFATTKAAAVLVHKKVKLPSNPAVPTLIVDDADLAVARVLELFAPPIPAPPKGADPSARVASTAQIDPTAAIGPNVVIGARSRIGAN